jgi:hypothetical protein
MSYALWSCFAAIAIALLLWMWGGTRRTVPLEVELKLTDQDYQPIGGVPIRLVFGTKDWQAENAGVRIVTAEDGTARFVTQAVIKRGWHFVNIGFTPFSMPLRSDHLFLGAELDFVVPRKEGGEAVHHFLYTADVNRLPGGDCSTYDLDKLYGAGPDGRFTTLIGTNAAGPNFDGSVDGWTLSNAGYRMWDSMLSRPDEEVSTGEKTWHLKLGLMRKPKPVLLR